VKLDQLREGRGVLRIHLQLLLGGFDLSVEGARGVLAWRRAEPVGASVAQGGTGATGVFGVGVVPEARGRGIGAALTVVAVRAFPAELAWLVPSDLARPMYERLGFRELVT
jgi:GNAT superfamily N-acetyltransferase